MKVIHDIRIDYQSTPALWMAYRGDGEKIEHSGLGKTPIEALAHLIEQEIAEEAEYCPKCDSGDTSFVHVEDCGLVYQKCGKCGDEWGHASPSQPD